MLKSGFVAETLAAATTHFAIVWKMQIAPTQTTLIVAPMSMACMSHVLHESRLEDEAQKSGCFVNGLLLLINTASGTIALPANPYQADLPVCLTLPQACQG